MHATIRAWAAGLTAAFSTALAAALTTALATLPAAAQTVTLEPSAITRCLLPAAAARGLPELPFDAWKRGQNGRVLVELSFTSPDQRPKVTVLSSEGDGDSASSFIDAVREHVAAYRLPCLDKAAGVPARLRLEFVFLPNTRTVQSLGPQDPEDARRSELFKCVAHTSGDMRPGYPVSARRAEVQGRVLARLRFSAKDQAPQAEVMARPTARRLASAVDSFVKGYRMPCFDGGAPVTSIFTFTFTFEGDGAYGLKPLGLMDLMSRVRGIRQQALQFDTTAMACPFEVQFQYRQPYVFNWVAETDPQNPARGPLLDWLAEVHLELPAQALDAVFADHTVITVPCARINLKPQETP